MLEKHPPRQAKRTLLGTLAAGTAMFWVGVILSSLAIGQRFPETAKFYAAPLCCLGIAGLAMSVAMVILDVVGS